MMKRDGTSKLGEVPGTEREPRHGGGAAARIAAMRSCVVEGRPMTIDGVEIHPGEALAACVVYDLLHTTARWVFASLPAPVMVAAAFDVMKHAVIAHAMEAKERKPEERTPETPAEKPVKEPVAKAA